MNIHRARPLVERLGIGFVGLWLEAPLAALISRVSSRRHKASDADAAVVTAQARGETGVVGWFRIEASASPEIVLDRARSLLRDHLPQDPQLGGGQFPERTMPS